MGIFGAGLFDDWRRSVTHRYALEVEEAEQRPLTTATRITWDAPAPRSEGPGARFFPDGTLVYHRTNDDQSPAYVRLDPASGGAAADRRHAGRRPGRPDPRRRGPHLPAGRLRAGSPFGLLANSDLAGTISIASTSRPARSDS